MPTCSVFSCKKRSETSSVQKDNVTFHLFPKDAMIRDVWIRACANHVSWIPKRTSTICSQHFETSCFIIQSNNKRRLKHCAVPTLKLSEMIQATLVVKLEQDLNVPTTSTPVINLDPEQSLYQTQTIPLEQTNQVVIKMEEGGIVQSVRGSLVPTTSSNIPTCVKPVSATPSSDPLDEPLEYVQSTKKKLWNTILSLRKKLELKNMKIKRLHERNRRMRIKIENLEAKLKDTVESEDDQDCDVVENDDE